MAGAAIAEVTVFVGIGVEAEFIDLGDAFPAKSGGDIFFNIELEMVRPACREKAVIG